MSELVSKGKTKDGRQPKARAKIGQKPRKRSREGTSYHEALAWPEGHPSCPLAGRRAYDLNTFDDHGSKLDQIGRSRDAEFCKELKYACTAEIKSTISIRRINLVLR
ncbi:hypothetical protein Fot_37410 [Forsythia ovata]|uniref:Uncharacterized protein n=1 Tax=Forsythia ovata TaxID=205694 RepID=A0ABD1RYW9_9LAMI